MLDRRHFKTLFVIGLFVVIDLIAVSHLRKSYRKVPQSDQVKDQLPETVINATSIAVSYSETEQVTDVHSFDMEDFMRLMSSRRQRIERVCKKRLKVPNSFMMNKNFFILNKQSIVWCPVFKAASSNWMEKIVKLSGKKLDPKFDNEWPIRRAERVVTKGTNRHILERAMASPTRTSFILVRHPFERIVAAFRDKIERTHGNNKYYKTKFGDKIVKKFRRKAIDLFGKEYFEKAHNYGAGLPVIPESRRKPSDNLPIFWEFVQYLTSTSSPNVFDEHWRPISVHCNVCKKGIQLDFVIKVEHLNEEDAFLSYKNWQYVNDGPQTSYSNVHHNLSSSEITELYFKDIPDEDILKLYNIYEADFLLFDYHFKRGTLEVP